MEGSDVVASDLGPLSAMRMTRLGHPLSLG